MMGASLKRIARGKPFETEQSSSAHLEQFVFVDTNVPENFVACWNVSKTVHDSVTAYLTGTSSNYTLHIYGAGQAKDYVLTSNGSSYSAPWASYTSGIKHFIVHDGVTYIGQLTLYGGTPRYELQDASFPSTVRIIQRSAFLYMRIQSVQFGIGLRRIGEGAFQSYTGNVSSGGLSIVDIPPSVKVIDYSAFNGTTWFKNLPNGYTTVGNGCLIQYKGTSTSLELPSTTRSVCLFNWQQKAICTSVSLNDGLKYIAAVAFSGFSSVTKMELPDGCKAIYSMAFMGMSGLSAIYLPSSIEKISCTTIQSYTAVAEPIAVNSPFPGCNASLKIYCEIEEADKPDGWEQYWNYLSADTMATVYWGVSRAEYRAATGG